MVDKFMYIPNGDKQNYPFCRLQLVVETLNLINQPIKIRQKSPRLLSLRIIKCYFKTLGTSLKKSNIPSLPVYF